MKISDKEVVIKIIKRISLQSWLIPFLEDTKVSDLQINLDELVTSLELYYQNKQYIYIPQSEVMKWDTVQDIITTVESLTLKLK
jgi:acyl carrier protein